MSNQNDSSNVGASALRSLLNSQSARASSSSSSSDASGSLTKNKNVGQNDFLKMLVTQLKNQDPLNPMDNNQFAVDLAQFSQVEQLISINDKLGNSSATDSASYAGYLGQEVELNNNTVSIKNHDGGKIYLDLPADATNVKLQLKAADGSIREELEIGDLAAGKHAFLLKDLTNESGDFSAQVVTGSAGTVSSTIKATAAGLITGFIPGKDGALLMGDRQVKITDIKQVNAVDTSSTTA